MSEFHKFAPLCKISAPLPYWPMKPRKPRLATRGRRRGEAGATLSMKPVTVNKNVNL